MADRSVSFDDRDMGTMVAALEYIQRNMKTCSAIDSAKIKDQAEMISELEGAVKDTMYEKLDKVVDGRQC